MTEQQRNGYEDSDFRDIIAEIEGYEEEKTKIMAEAAGRCSGLAKQIANAKKTATKLKIPKAVLVAVLKQRKLERKLQELAEDVPDDLAEVYVDAAGQFSFLKPEDDESEDDIPATRAAKMAAKKASERHDAEQAEGDAYLREQAESFH